MSNQEIFDNIRNNFNSEDEDDEDEQFLNNRVQSLYKRKRSLNSDNKIRENLGNNEDEKEEEEEKEENENIKKSNRDEFGYFINNNENEENEESEKSNSNYEEKEKNSSNVSEQYFENNSNKEESSTKEKNNNNSVQEDNGNKSEKIDKEKNNINENSQKLNINNNKENEFLKDEKFNEANEENDLINELYTKKSENLEIGEGEGFGKYSFRPDPIPISPKFNEKIPKNNPKNLITLDDILTNDDKINNKNNNNLNNFSETIETKIEGDISNENSTEINPINKENNKENNEFQKEENIYVDKEEENKDKNFDEEQKEEEEFLKREELKRQKINENNENINNVNNKKENINDKIEYKGNYKDIKNNDNINNKKDSNNEIEDNKIRNMSFQVLEKYQKAGDSQSSKRQSNNYFNNKNKKYNTSNKKNNNKNYGYYTEQRAETRKNKKINDDSSKKYSFSPNINKKSRAIWKKNNKRPNTPIGVLLYEEAINKKEKLNKKCIDKNNSIIINANRKKINNNSYILASNRINKKIEDIIKKYSKDGKISLVGIIQVLNDLNIITELIKIKDNIKDANDYLDSVELQSIIESINIKDQKRLKEVELVEQFWFIINPSQTKYVNSEIFSKILKILFSSNNDIRDQAKKIENILNKYNLNNNDNDNDNQIENKEYSSPLRDKTYNKNEKWPLTKLIKYFLKIKRNLKAYKDNNYKANEKYNNMVKEKNKDLTFKPDFISNSFFYKHSKYDYYKDINNICSQKENSSIIKKKKKNKFDKIYDRFMAEKELQEKTLEVMRKIKMEKELKQCTLAPKINKYIPRTPKRLSMKEDKIEDLKESSKILKKNKSFINNGPRKYKKLYNLRKNKNNNINRIDNNYTFKPELIDNKNNIDRMKNIKKPKGYDDYIKRSRNAIEQKEFIKKIEEDKKSGKNYEKIKGLKLKPFNITDLNDKNKKVKKMDIQLENTSGKNEENYKGEKKEIMIDDIYITIDIKIPNGLLKPLKIYNKNYNDTITKVNEFCKIYSINDENKKMILKKVIQCKNLFFGRYDPKNQDDFIINEDLDTIPNSGVNSNDY